jgi:DNA-binding ferritin-like protein (Dps family)
MKDNKGDVEDMVDDATAAINEIIDDARAKWEDRYRYELLNAKFQQDSYYRFHLMLLVGQKNKACH